MKKLWNFLKENAVKNTSELPGNQPEIEAPVPAQIEPKTKPRIEPENSLLKWVNADQQKPPLHRHSNTYSDYVLVWNGNVRQGSVQIGTAYYDYYQEGWRGDDVNVIFWCAIPPLPQIAAK